MANFTYIHLHSDFSNGVTNVDSITKYDEYISRAKEVLNSYKGYKDLPIEEQNKFQLPYMQISFLINEMINLERVSNDGELIKLKEPSTKRKDRYSSLGYAVYISKQLELKLKPKNNNKIDISSLFRFNMLHFG